jgi:polyhydroxybutyrate depolymerase
MRQLRCIAAIGFLMALAILIATLDVSHAFAGQKSIRSPGRHSGSIKVGKLKRRFVICMPENPTRAKSASGVNKLPVVIVLHGALTNAWTVEFDSGLTKRANKDGFIAVYPYGTGIGPRQILFWNAGACCATASARQVDDVAFIRRLIEYLKVECGADEKRIYVAGVSNGGMMAYRLATEIPGEIAAIGSVEGCMFPAHAEPDQAVSVIEFHGTADSVIPYDGGTGYKMGYKIRGILPVKKTVDYWISHNRCKPESQRKVNGLVTRELFSGGDGDSAVCLVSIAGGKHMWPGGRCATLVGNASSHSLNASDEMMQFFVDHPKK